MKQIFLITTLLVFSWTAAQAALVQYIDENGEPRVVNTEYESVPPEFLYQVTDQMEDEDLDLDKILAGFDEPDDSLDELSPEMQEKVRRARKAVSQLDYDKQEDGKRFIEEIIIKAGKEEKLDLSPLEEGEQEIEVAYYTSSNCFPCQLFEAALKSKQVKYEVRNIDNPDVYDEFTEFATREDLPVTVIGSKIIPKGDIATIITTIRENDY